MSTSLLYHGFGIVGYRYIRTDYQKENIIFTIFRKFHPQDSILKSIGIWTCFDFAKEWGKVSGTMAANVST